MISIHLIYSDVQFVNDDSKIINNERNSKFKVLPTKPHPKLK